MKAVAIATVLGVTSGQMAIKASNFEVSAAGAKGVRKTRLRAAKISQKGEIVFEDTSLAQP